MIKVKLTRITSNHNNLRTDSVEGETEQLPTPGEDFVLLGVGLEFGTRMVRTTPVGEVMNLSEKEMEFKTKNSHYRLELL